VGRQRAVRNHMKEEHHILSNYLLQQFLRGLDVKSTIAPKPYGQEHVAPHHMYAHVDLADHQNLKNITSTTVN
jgi:hypothetical protein